MRASAETKLDFKPLFCSKNSLNLSVDRQLELRIIRAPLRLKLEIKQSLIRLSV